MKEKGQYLKGLIGEKKAEKLLKREGYRVLARRFRAAGGEIDLICRDGDTTVFVEVKARPQGRLGEGARAVNGKKRERMKNAASHYLRFHPCACVRFDVIEISAAGLRHMKNAF